MRTPFSPKAAQDMLDKYFNKRGKEWSETTINANPGIRFISLTAPQIKDCSVSREMGICVVPEMGYYHVDYIGEGCIKELNERLESGMFNPTTDFVLLNASIGADDRFIEHVFSGIILSNMAKL